MRIAIVSREYPPETAWGGIGTFYAAFARGLREAGHDVEVFTQGLTEDRMEERDGILIHRVIPRKWIVGKRAGGDLGGMGARFIGLFALSLAVAMAARVRLRHRAKPFDLVEGHEHLGINSLVNLLLRGRCATVTRYHTTYHSLVRRKLVDWPASLLIQQLEGLSIRSAHARVSASAFIDRMTGEDFPGAPECTAVIPLLSEPENLGAGPPLTSREKLMIFAGRMVPGHKAPDLAAAAFAALAGEFPEWKIEFAGANMPSGASTAWDVCEQLLKAFPGRYNYHGVLDAAGIQRLYRRARVILIPSRFESFGLVALEAMAAGAVPIVADETALPEVTGESGLVFRNGSLDDLTRKLREILRDERRQEALSIAARERASVYSSPKRIISQNLEMFRQIVAVADRSGKE